MTEEVEQWMKSRNISWPFSDEETKVEFLLTWA
jgi:hypothetical protein